MRVPSGDQVQGLHRIGVTVIREFRLAGGGIPDLHCIITTCRSDDESHPLTRPQRVPGPYDHDSSKQVDLWQYPRPARYDPRRPKPGVYYQATRPAAQTLAGSAVYREEDLAGLCIANLHEAISTSQG